MSRKIGEFPGLQRQRTKAGDILHWVASRQALAAGYPARTVRLNGYDDPGELSRRCIDLHNQMIAWLNEPEAGEISINYDGTVGSLCDVYDSHPDSPYHDTAPGTQRVYADVLRLIRRTVGARRVGRLTGLDFRRWYREYRKPATPGGPERIRRAHSAMTQLRIVFSFGALLELPHCRLLREVLGTMRFEDAAAREEQITFEQTAAFIGKAHELGFPEMALAQALQFEAMLRQWDVIGEWSRPRDTARYARGGWRWSKGIIWNDIDADRVLRKKTSKTSADVAVDLSLYPLVTRELDRITERRAGPVIIDSRTDQPFRRRDYSERWRQIARAAGIPDNVWNRDIRAGGVTEALDAGAELEDAREQAGHASLSTTQLYNRATLSKTRRVAKLRVAHRNEP